MRRRDEAGWARWESTPTGSNRASTARTTNDPRHVRDTTYGKRRRQSGAAQLDALEKRGDWLRTPWGWAEEREVIHEERAMSEFSAELLKSPTAFDFAVRGALRLDRNDVEGAMSDFDAAIRLDAKCAAPSMRGPECGIGWKSGTGQSTIMMP